jgi:hypothetical protein
MYGVSVCTTCMSVHSSHRRHALSFLFIDLGLKILKPENRSQSQFCLCVPILLSNLNLNSTTLFFVGCLCSSFELCKLPPPSKERRYFVHCLYTWKILQMDGSGCGTWVRSAPQLTAEMKFCQIVVANMYILHYMLHVMNSSVLWFYVLIDAYLC